MFGLTAMMRAALFRLDGPQFASAFNVCNSIRWRMPVRLDYLPDVNAYLVSDITTTGPTPSKIAFARKERIWAYTKGVQARVEQLGRVYNLDACKIRPSDTVVDCGANVGEFSALVRSRFACRVLSVEPETAEARCITRNVPGVAAVINSALWSETKELQFFSKNRSADSSLFETADYDAVTKVQAVSLEQLAKEHGVTRIKLFKLEAEGAEPEILLGARNLLPNIEYISADLGPERGLAQESTVVPVCNFLFEHGFRLVAHYHRRQVYLFRNQTSAEPS